MASLTQAATLIGHYFFLYFYLDSNCPKLLSPVKHGQIIHSQDKIELKGGREKEKFWINGITRTLKSKVSDTTEILETNLLSYLRNT